MSGLGRGGRGEHEDPEVAASASDMVPAEATGSSAVDLGCIREPRLGRPSRRTAEVGLGFGIPLYGVPVTIVEPTRIELMPGRIVLLVGPSGSGKSSALGEIGRQFAGARMVDRVSFDPDEAIIDQIAPGATLGEAAGMLTSCGMGEPHLWVRRFAELSDGEKFRARLARAVALQTRGGTAAPLMCDEFCSTLHRRAAKAISFNLRRLVAGRRLAVILACGHDDVIPDLQPDLIVRLRGHGRSEIERRDRQTRRAFSLKRRLRIERGGKRDYRDFASMHYRATDELGFVDRVFVMREGRAGDVLGIVVYAHSPLRLALRNRTLGGEFSQNSRRLNRCFRILRRLVIHPDVRGCGLGHYLVRKTLPLVGTEYVECLAGMGEFNPVFEKAGMQRIGRYDIPPKCQAALEALRAMDVDPHSREFPMLVARRRRVRAVVGRVVRDWYTRTTGGGEVRVERQSPQTLAQTFRGVIASRPVYYLWRKDVSVKKTKAA